MAYTADTLIVKQTDINRGRPLNFLTTHCLPFHLVWKPLWVDMLLISNNNNNNHLVWIKF